MPIEINMTKARTIHMGRIRVKRNEKLVELDVPFMQSIEVGDDAAKASIGQQKQALRDLPSTFDLSVAETPEELNGLWPEGLDR